MSASSMAWTITIALLVIGLAPVPLALAEEAAAPPEAAQFLPAVSRTDNFSLAEQISFPWDYASGEDFSVSLACTVHVSDMGKLAHPFCLGGNDSTQNLERRILSATERAKMVPARYKGRRTPVVFKFTVIFSRSNGEASVSVVPNQFFNVDQFGPTYIAPQLMTNKTKAIGYPASCRGANVIMRVTVNELGKVTAAEPHRSDSDICVRRIKQRLARLHYIPGFVEGKPVTMEHLYLSGWRGSWAMYGGRE